MFPEFSHRFADELPELSVRTRAAETGNAQTVLINRDHAEAVGLAPDWLHTDEGAAFLTGTALPDGAQPVAQLYAGHQFGSFSPMLGDGRALLAGEIRSPSGATVDLHLKGTGPTPVARGDGFATLEAVFREFLMSEAMHALGVPTTRALAATFTGHTLFRPTGTVAHRQPGAVLARTATSHIRVGSFQLARTNNDDGLLRRLTEFTIARHDSDLVGSADAPFEFFVRVIARQARLIAKWMLLGFVHGVMNTDNMLVSGETIDYGPCAFLDVYRPEQAFSSIDLQDRYAYVKQPGIAAWNLARLGDAMIPLFGESETQAVSRAEAALTHFDEVFTVEWQTGLAHKLGLPHVNTDIVLELANQLLAHMREQELDYTRTWRLLTSVADRPDHTVEGIETWVNTWRKHAPERAIMEQANPIYIPRNRHVQQALIEAVEGDYTAYETLLSAVTQPFTAQPEYEHLETAPYSKQHAFITYCGT